MKKNQIIFVVTLAAVLFVATFIITIFAVFKVQTFQIESALYEKSLIDSGIVEKLQQKVEEKYKGHNSIFFGMKEVETAIQELNDNNKNYLIVEKIEKRSAKEVYIKIGQRKIDNYYYQDSGRYYHFNSDGVLLQITNSSQNQLLKTNNVALNGVVTLNTNLQIGQVVTGSNDIEKQKWNSLAVVLQKLDDYFAKDKQYRTNSYLTNIAYTIVGDVNKPDYQNFKFTIVNDWHFTDIQQKGDYQIEIIDIIQKMQEKANAMSEKLPKKEAAHNLLTIGNDVQNGSVVGVTATWTTK